MGFFHQFELVIKNKKVTTNKVADMLLTSSLILQNSSLAHESYIEQYVEDTDFKDVTNSWCSSGRSELSCS